MNNVVVKIEMSGNRYNAFDFDGKKYTSWYDYLTDYRMTEEKINVKDLIESTNFIKKLDG